MGSHMPSSEDLFSFSGGWVLLGKGLILEDSPPPPPPPSRSAITTFQRSPGVFAGVCAVTQPSHDTEGICICNQKNSE